MQNISVLFSKLFILVVPFFNMCFIHYTYSANHLFYLDIYLGDLTISLHKGPAHFHFF